MYVLAAGNTNIDPTETVGLNQQCLAGFSATVLPTSSMQVIVHMIKSYKLCVHHVDFYVVTKIIKVL